MINKRPFCSFLAGLSSLTIGTACSDYDCHDTATCPVEPDGGASVGTDRLTEAPGSTLDGTSTDSTESTPSSTTRPASSATDSVGAMSSSEVLASTDGDVETSSEAVAHISSEAGDPTSGESGGQNSEQPGAELGASCETGSECESEFCADGVCCESECTGPCQTCAADGACNETPDNDPECGVITCPASNLCATYPSPNTAPECLTFGQCATEADYCLPTFTDSGTTCGTGLECDGAGSCESVCGAGEVWCDDACVGEGSCRTWREPQSLVEVSRRISIARAAVTESGNVAVAWIEYESDNTVSKDLMARFYDADTETWSAPTTVHTTSTYMANVTVAPSGPDGFVFLWDESPAGTIARYWNGSGFGQEATLGGYARVASNGRSSLIASWAAEDDDTGEYSVLARVWNAQSSNWRSTQTLHSAAQYSVVNAVSVSGSGQAFVVWGQEATDPNTSDWEAWGARLAQESGDWGTANQFGWVAGRASGFGLGITSSGDLVGYLGGRLKGVLWDANDANWVNTNSSGDWLNLQLCSLETQNILLAEPSRLQRWNRASGRISPAVELSSETDRLNTASLSCANKSALVTSVDGASTRYDRWDEVSGTWLAPHTSSDGRVLAQALGADGTAIVVRSADYQTQDLGVEVDILR